MNKYYNITNTTYEVMNMEKSFEEERQAQKKSNEEFNSITNKVKVENQNQTHNSRREGIGPQNQRR
ncbi:MAG: hypothetical protein Q4G58_01975 [bacterium]|nr:hypothetical protein [bacterium]